MKKKNISKYMKEVGMPEYNSEIHYSKEFDKADKNLSAYLKKLPLTPEQHIEVLSHITELLIYAQNDGFMQGLSEGFNSGFDWNQKFIETIAKENAEKYDVRLYEKIENFERKD